MRSGGEDAYGSYGVESRMAGFGTPRRKAVVRTSELTSMRMLHNERLQCREYSWLSHQVDVLGEVRHLRCCLSPACDLFHFDDLAALCDRLQNGPVSATHVVEHFGSGRR